jgi:hypothetical protein
MRTHVAVAMRISAVVIAVFPVVVAPSVRAQVTDTSYTIGAGTYSGTMVEVRRATAVSQRVRLLASRAED